MHAESSSLGLLLCLSVRDHRGIGLQRIYDCDLQKGRRAGPTDDQAATGIQQNCLSNDDDVQSCSSCAVRVYYYGQAEHLKISTLSYSTSHQCYDATLVELVRAHKYHEPR
jgi:hypothetical protein